MKLLFIQRKQIGHMSFNCHGWQWWRWSQRRWSPCWKKDSSEAIYTAQVYSSVEGHVCANACMVASI